LLHRNWALAQAASPFETGRDHLVTSLTTLATPIVRLLVMALGVSAAEAISWGWPIGGDRREWVFVFDGHSDCYLGRGLLPV